MCEKDWRSFQLCLVGQTGLEASPLRGYGLWEFGEIKGIK